MAVDKKATAVPSAESEKMKQMIVLLKESIDIKRTELADTKEEIRRLKGRTKEIEKSIKRFEKLMNARTTINMRLEHNLIQI